MSIVFYLVDTNIFFHEINNSISQVVDKCFGCNSDICITKAVLRELAPENVETVKNAREIYNQVYNFITLFGKIKLIDILNDKAANEEYKRIRKQYYGWMTRHDYLQQLIAEGRLTVEEVRKPSFRNKDCGECELIALACTHPDEYTIISNDIGRVYKHPDMNLFETYSNMGKIKVLTGAEWMKEMDSKM